MNRLLPHLPAIDEVVGAEDISSSKMETASQDSEATNQVTGEETEPPLSMEAVTAAAEAADLLPNQTESPPPALETSLPAREASYQADEHATKTPEAHTLPTSSPLPGMAEIKSLQVTQSNLDRARFMVKKWKEEKASHNDWMLGWHIFRHVREEVLAFIQCVPGTPEFEILERDFFFKYVEYLDQFRWSEAQVRKHEETVGRLLLKSLLKQSKVTITVDTFTKYLAYVCGWFYPHDHQHAENGVETMSAGVHSTGKGVQSDGEVTKGSDPTRSAINHSTGGDTKSAGEDNDRTTRDVPQYRMTNLTFLSPQAREHFPITHREVITVTLLATDSEDVICRKGLALGRGTRAEISEHFSQMKDHWDVAYKLGYRTDLVVNNDPAVESDNVIRNVVAAKKLADRYFHGTLQQGFAVKFLDCFLVGFKIFGAVAKNAINIATSEQTANAFEAVSKERRAVAQDEALKLVPPLMKFIVEFAFACSKLEKDEKSIVVMGKTTETAIVNALSRLSADPDSEGLFCFMNVYSSLYQWRFSYTVIVNMLQDQLNAVSVLGFPSCESFVTRHAIGKIVRDTHGPADTKGPEILIKTVDENEVEGGEIRLEERSADGEPAYLKLIIKHFADKGFAVDKLTVRVFYSACGHKIADTVMKIKELKGWKF